MTRTTSSLRGDFGAGALFSGGLAGAGSAGMERIRSSGGTVASRRARRRDEEPAAGAGPGVA
ncbi:MAG: hypothetical protein M3R58_06770 [Pseudomonadota bacterium]|nr:hypothetical protein [Pseudomonadota bacterium]